jgi:hypothetical protein
MSDVLLLDYCTIGVRSLHGCTAMHTAGGCCCAAAVLPNGVTRGSLMVLQTA